MQDTQQWKNWVENCSEVLGHHKHALTANAFLLVKVRPLLLVERGAM